MRVFGALLAVASGTVGFVPLGVLLALVGFVPLVERTFGALSAVAFVSAVGSSWSASDIVLASCNTD